MIIYFHLTEKQLKFAKNTTRIAKNMTLTFQKYIHDFRKISGCLQVFFLANMIEKIVIII